MSQQVFLIFNLATDAAHAQTRLELLNAIAAGYGVEVCEDLGTLFPSGLVACICPSEISEEFISSLSTIKIRPLRKLIEVAVS